MRSKKRAALTTSIYFIFCDIIGFVYVLYDVIDNFRFASQTEIVRHSYSRFLGFVNLPVRSIPSLPGGGWRIKGGRKDGPLAGGQASTWLRVPYALQCRVKGENGVVTLLRVVAGIVYVLYATSTFLLLLSSRVTYVVLYYA